MLTCFIAGDPIPFGVTYPAQSESVPFVVSPSNHRSWEVNSAIDMTYARLSMGLRTNGIFDCMPACFIASEPVPFVVNPSRSW